MKSRLCTLFGLAHFHSPCHGRISNLTLGCQDSVALQNLVQWRSLLLHGKHISRARLALFSSSANSHQTQPKPESEESKPSKKRTSARSPAGKNSLRKVAIEAQRSRDKSLGEAATADGQISTKTVTAFCAAEEYDMARADQILNPYGRDRDPYGIGLFPQVLHIEIDNGTQTKGDLFVFPSGTVVAWAVHQDIVSKLVNESLVPAALNPHLAELEEEDLEFMEDPSKETSSIKGDTITIGTKLRTIQPDIDTVNSQTNGKSSTRNSNFENEMNLSRIRDTVLAKVAFSSGLARSTKLAVLESLLRNYLQSTKPLVERLSNSGRLPRRRPFILRRTGHLLDIRAKLNLYSELTDSLPDLFWDSRSELGLEGNYDHVGRALDTNIRVKELNQKMNYAQEITDVLREALNERHGLRLEWIIIILIGVEIGFNILHEYRYRREEGAKEAVEKA